MWTTNGAISGVGDNEQIALASGQWAESEMVAIGTDEIEILTGKYVATEGTVIIKYKDGDSEANCDLDTWHTYTGPFTPTGYVRVRLEAP